MPCHRDPKVASAYRRSDPSREPYDVVLIVCEGRKSEPNYFSGLRSAYGLSSVNVRVLPPPGQDPMSIVNFAIQQLDRDKEYDRAYCVFDRDGHAGFDAAVQAVRESKYGKQQRLFAITSIPCFEVWVLLHYQYSAAAYIAGGGHSACERVIREIQKHYPQYAKGSETVFADLVDLLDQALEHAVRLEQHNRKAGGWNPSTQMHHLVDYLTNLKEG